MFQIKWFYIIAWSKLYMLRYTETIGQLKTLITLACEELIACSEIYNYSSAYMRHSTLLPWLQKGQLKTVSSLSIRFFVAGLALDFLFPIFKSSSKKKYNKVSRNSIKINTWYLWEERHKEKRAAYCTPSTSREITEYKRRQFKNTGRDGAHTYTTVPVH